MNYLFYCNGLWLRPRAVLYVNNESLNAQLCTCGARFIGYKLQTFMFLGIALLVDIFDGTLARKYKTETIFPNIDGKTLDTIIDYINYIFIPCIMIYKFGYLPPNFTIMIPIFIICVSLYSYVNTELVDTSFSYIGFPSIWNVILLYLEILSLNQWINLFTSISHISN